MMYLFAEEVLTASVLKLSLMSKRITNLETQIPPSTHFPELEMEVVRGGPPTSADNF